MKKEDLFDAIGEIDAAYIDEAKNISQKKKPYGFIKYIAVAACLCIAISISFLLLHPDRNAKDYSVIAAEIGAAEMPFGATVPTILYADEYRVIMYDYIGIWVYDLENEKLSGFCDFRPLHMTQIQGDPCVFVNATQDGRYVRFYMNDGSANYLYDVEKDTYKKVDSYSNETDFFYYKPEDIDIMSDEALSTYCNTYRMINQSDTYVSYRIDSVDSDHPNEVYGLQYNSLVLLVKHGDEINEYFIFQ